MYMYVKCLKKLNKSEFFRYYVFVDALLVYLYFLFHFIFFRFNL